MTVTINSASKMKLSRSLKGSHLHQNPFALLGVTTRDHRRRIVELAEEKSLELDHDLCQKARTDLTSPRTRLSIEVSWLPGISPRKASQLLAALLKRPMLIREASGLPTLAHLNLMAAAFEVVSDKDAVGDIARFIQKMAFLVEDLSVSQVLRDINEDRSVSGFPEVRGEDLIDTELSERKRYYRTAIKTGLNKLPIALLVDVMTVVVNDVTSNGEVHAPELIDELVDSYEVETQGFLQQEGENIQRLIESVIDSAKSGENAVQPQLDKLDEVARNWDNVAQPIQLSAKARGKDHDASNTIAYSIRDLAIALINEYGMLNQSQKLTGLVQELFAELPEFLEQVEQDVDALANIFLARRQAEEQSENQAVQWAHDITYRVEVGLIFKDTLSISPDGITWKNQHISLEAITQVRWGAVRNSVNGVPTGTDYTIAVGNDRSEIIVELKNGTIYSTFLEKLWAAVGFRLLAELFESLRAGKKVSLGEGVLRDDGVTLVKHKFLGSNEAVHCSWAQVHIWSADGAFFIGAKDDKKAFVALSYIYGNNTHIIEQAIRMGFKSPNMRKLSDALEH